MGKRRIANQLVNALGKTLTVPDLGLNEQDYCALVFDGDMLLNMEYDAAGERMLLYSYLGEIPETGAEDLLRKLLAANFFWYRTNGATLSLEEETQGILLAYAHPVSDLDAVKFERICDNFVRTAETWKEKLTSLKEAAGSSRPEEKGGGPADFAGREGMIRV